MAQESKESPSLSSSPLALKFRFSSELPIARYSHQQWMSTIRRIAPAILNLNRISARAFDGENASKGYGTAFIVDKVRGIAVTNHHVVQDGPATYSLSFISGEALPAQRLYTDPAYDFAFVRFDPSLIQYTKLLEIELRPDGAQSGGEILVLGNDSGEKLLCCQGVLTGSLYWDNFPFKSNYGFHKRASIASYCGSSGSPVLDIHGKAIALNSLGNSGIAGFVPLHRVFSALEILKRRFDDNIQRIEVPRKTLGALFCLSTLKDLINVGIIDEIDSSYIAQEYGDSVFCVRNVHMRCYFEEGDILLELNEEKLDCFTEVETIVDGMNKDYVTVKLARKDCVTGSLDIWEINTNVFSIRDDMPTKIIEIAGSSIYTASHRMALDHGIVVGDLFVHQPGACLESCMDNNTVITSINGNQIYSVDDFIENIEKTILMQQHMKLKTNKLKTTIVDDSLFYRWISLPFLWRFLPYENTWTREPLKVIDISSKDGIGRLCGDSYNPHDEEYPFSLTSYLPSHQPMDNNTIKNRFVKVSYDIPSYIANINNVSSDYWRWGIGVVLCRTSKMGIVLVSQSNAPLIFGNVCLTFMCGLKTSGTVFFVDINHGFSLIYFDAAYCHPYIESAKLSVKPLRDNDRLSLFCGERQLEDIGSTDSGFKCLQKDYFHYYFDALIGCEDITNMSGLIVDDEFKVTALFGNISQVYPVSSMLKPLDLVLKSFFKNPRDLCYSVNLPVLQAKLVSIPPHVALTCGLNYGWLKEIFSKPRSYRQYLIVDYCLPDSNAGKFLEQDDIILSVNGEHVSCIQDLDVRLFEERDLIIKILRRGFEQDICIEREFISKQKNTKVLLWCELLIQDAPRDLYLNGGFSPPKGVLVNWAYYFHRGGDCCWIIAVNGVEVTNLNEFIEATNMFNDGEDVVCKMITQRGETIVWNFHLDFLHFPTIEVTFDEVGQYWNKKEISKRKL